MPDVLGINRIQIALAERQVMDRIQQIGLSNPVLTHKAIDLGTQLKISLLIILEIYN
jgi:hypothetical protein